MRGCVREKIMNAEKKVFWVLVDSREEEDLEPIPGSRELGSGRFDFQIENAAGKFVVGHKIL